MIRMMDVLIEGFTRIDAHNWRGSEEAVFGFRCRAETAGP
jgi:hypothetical protein